MTESEFSTDSILRIGTVFSVDGRTVTVRVDKEKNSSHLLFNGHLIKNVSVNSYIKIVKGFTKIICKIDGEFVEKDTKYPDYSNERDRINRSLRVSLLGFFAGRAFERGIKELPLIGNECYILSHQEFKSVHNFVTTGDEGFTIGHLALEAAQGISLGVDSVFASHVGIFGNTGSGKSYTLAKLYYELFKLYKDNPEFKKNAKFFLIDFNGEYVSKKEEVIVGKTYKNVYKLSSDGDGDKIPISIEAVHDIDFWKVILQATEKTQTPFLKRAVNNSSLQGRLSNSRAIANEATDLILLAIDRKDGELGAGVISDFLSDLYDIFNDGEILNIRNQLREKLQWNAYTKQFTWVTEVVSESGRNMREEVERTLRDLTFDAKALSVLDMIRIRIIFKYYDEIVKGYAQRDHLSPLIKRMESRFAELKNIIQVSDSSDRKNNLTIISLKNVSIEMKKLLPLLLCKQLYNDKKLNKSSSNYLNIIIDEAHNILSTESFRESESWKDYRLETFEEIIKEGRKFGVFLTLVSQRPSDISSTIISQLHNYFIHRLINNNDIHAIERTVSYLDRVSFEYLPILPTGTCIVAGVSSQVPVIVEINRIPERFEPFNKTLSLVEFWGKPKRRRKKSSE